MNDWSEIGCWSSGITSDQFNHYLKQTCKNKYDHALLQKALGKLWNLIQDKGVILLWRSIFFYLFVIILKVNINKLTLLADKESFLRDCH